MAERKQKRITVEPVSMSVVSLDKHGHLQHTKFDEAVSVSFGLVSVTGAELKEAVTVWLASMAGKEAARQAGVMVDEESPPKEMPKAGVTLLRETFGEGPI